MKISLDWLRDYLPGKTNAAEAAEVLTHGGFPVESVENFGTDAVLDVEVTSNRGDLLSHVGVARELSALMGREFTDVTAPVATEVATPAGSVTSVAIDATDLCPHYTARILRNVKIGPSPEWLVRRLEAVGVRAINNVVDVTNYVMFELGQPLHAFDFDCLEGRRIVIRRARQGESIVSIDGHERKLQSDMLVIADAARPVALAGVMGGRDSEVSNATVNLLLESARFDPLSVRKTARSLQMRSDSSYRFERGIDPLLPEKASRRAAQLILETAGGELLSGAAEAGSPNFQPRQITLRLARLERLLGVALPVDAVLIALHRLQLAPVPKGETIEVTVPSHRLDVNIEADLIEEAARVIGYDKVPTRDEINVRLQPDDPARKAIEIIRSTLVAAGYFEAITTSFVSDALAADFVPPGANAKTPLPRTEAAVRSADASLRPSILPGLLESVRLNETKGTLGAKLYEIAATFHNDASGELVETRKVALVGSEDYREVRGTVEKLLARLDAQKPIRIVPDTRPGFSNAACGRIEWDGQTIGHVGKIDRGVTDKLSLRELPVAAELDLAPLLAGAMLVPQQIPLPKFPAVSRDLSFDLPESMRYAALEDVVRNVKPEYLEELKYVTTYRGKPLEKGRKSVTITLVFRSASETLTGEKVEASVQRVVDAAKEALGASLRA
jgi:phenylalanyl-tRNA synthetase beta chain